MTGKLLWEDVTLDVCIELIAQFKRFTTVLTDVGSFFGVAGKVLLKPLWDIGLKITYLFKK